MIVEEVSASIVCSKCGYGFDYSALAIHSKLEDVYNDYLKAHLDDCVRCNKGKLVLKNVKCILKRNMPKHIYNIKWECGECGTKWIQREFISRDQLVNGDALRTFRSSIVCPSTSCTSTDKRLIGMSKEK
jgi:transcription elongation factor Elf1